MSVDHAPDLRSLTERLTSDDAGARRIAVLDLIKRSAHDTSAMRTLLEHLRRETDEKCSLLIIRHAGHLLHAPALEVLRELRDDAKTPVRVAHAAILAHDRIERAGRFAPGANPPDASAMTPDDLNRLPTDTDDGMLLIISGPSGVGKTTITRGVERAIAGSVFSVSTTTRPKTDADVEGVDYHFVDEDEFREMEASGEFLETASVFGKLYGTPRAWVDEQLTRGRLVILEIDVLGARQVKATMPGAFGLFIFPPSEEELLNRLRNRKREDEEIIQRRFAEAKREMVEARECGAYDEFIVNSVLEDAIRDAIGLVSAERARRAAESAGE